MAHLPPSVILIGYRATGKSTVGRLLADRLGYGFVDTDRVIEQRQQTTIRQLVAERGWDFFRRLERQLLQELLEKPHLVIAAGGGAILQQQLWPQVRQAALVVWLQADRQTICQRLAGDQRTSDQRPSLTGAGIHDEVAAVLAEREPLYRQGSHLCVDSGAKSPPEIVEEIAAWLDPSLSTPPSLKES